MTTYNDPTRGPWCQTLSGGVEYPFSPRAEDINVQDFQALSKICRFGGHVTCPGIYSVAEHSVRCAQRAMELGLSRELQWAALIHDGHEIYGLGDVRGPMKFRRLAVTKEMQAWSAALEKMEAIHIVAVRNALRTSVVLPPEVKRIDMELLATERRDLMGPSEVEWGELPEPLSEKILNWTPWSAWGMFADSWNRLRPLDVAKLVVQ